MALKKYLKEFSKEKFLELGTFLFNAKEDFQSALNAGFCEDVINSILQVSQLELDEIRKNFENAIKDLDARNFFGQKFDNAECEIGFSFTLEEIPNVTFIGKIDGIFF